MKKKVIGNKVKKQFLLSVLVVCFVMVVVPLTNGNAVILDSDPPKLQSISINKHDVVPGDSITITAEITDESGVKDPSLSFSDGKSKTHIIDLLKQKDGTYSGSLEILDDFIVGRYEVGYIHLEDINGVTGTTYLASKQYPDLYFNVSGAIEDAEAPVLESIKINTHHVSDNDLVIITAEITDESGVKDPSLSFSDGKSKTHIVDLLKQEDGTYSGSLEILDDFIVGRYEVGYIHLEDINGVTGTIYLASKQYPDLYFYICPDKESIVIDEAKPATCTETGLTEGTHCSSCGAILIAQEEIAAIGHTEVIDEAKAATCTEKGLTEGKHCSVCDAVIVAQEEISAAGHLLVEYEKVDASTTATGTEAYWECTVCGKLFSDEEGKNQIEAPVEIQKIKDSWTIEDKHLLYYTNGEKVTGDVRINQTTYHFTDKGWLTGSGDIISIDFFHHYYIVNNELLSGWQKISDVWYYFDPNSFEALCHGPMEVEGIYYMLTPSLITDRWAYGWYADENGVVDITEGYRRIGDDYFYFGSNGSEYGFIKLDDGVHYFNSDGPGTGGRNFEHRGWQCINDCIYYFDVDTGVMSQGHCIIDGIDYEFYADGALKVINGIGRVGDKYYYFNRDSHIESGWKLINSDYYYFRPEMVIGPTRIMEDGYFVEYYFDHSGKWVPSGKLTGWVGENGKWFFYQDSGMVYTNGWLDVDDTWYYFRNDGEMATGWLNDNGTWYYLLPSGIMATGWLADGGTWYYFDTSGVMVTGWQQIGGTWYYFSTSGAMATGWLNDGGAWYYFNPSGAMVTGWLSDGGIWYYFKPSGAMITGWLSDGGTWYYFKSSGAMATGWISDGGKWYHFDASGVMATGWKSISGTWYYFKNSGAMATGWFEDKEAEYRLPADQRKALWYWFDNNGQMATGWKEINGQWEMFDSNGLWLYTWDGQ